MNKNIVVITGANSLIGREIVKVFLENNWWVHATISSKRKIKEQIIHSNLCYHEMDLEKSLITREPQNDLSIGISFCFHIFQS